MKLTPAQSEAITAFASRYKVPLDSLKMRKSKGAFRHSTKVDEYGWVRERKTRFVK
jgi:hypothetical protein